MRVLIVSRYAIVRAGLRSLLGSDLDIKVVGEVETLQQAEQAIPELRAAVVLMETVDANQADLMQFIATHAGNTHVVLLANFGELQVVRALLRAGLVGYVLKNSREAELLHAIRLAAWGRKFLDSSLIDSMALDTPASKAKPEQRVKLSQRQLQVLKSIVTGHTSGEIARALEISIKSVETYRSRIYAKLELHSRVELMQYAASMGLISFNEPMNAPDALQPTCQVSITAPRSATHSSSFQPPSSDRLTGQTSR